MRELRDIVANDRFPFSPRIQRLKRILSKLGNQGSGPRHRPIRAIGDDNRRRLYRVRP
jgi:hypothetical protein